MAGVLVFLRKVLCRNMIAAQFHGKILRQLCEMAEEGVVTNHFLDSVIFVDSHLAAEYLIRPVLDIETWVPNVYKSTWRKVDSHIYKITAETEEKLHHTVAPQSLRDIFVRTRQAIVLLHRSEEAKVYEIDFETIYYWLNSHSYVDSGILIDRYLTLVEEATALPTASASLEIAGQPFESLGAIYTQSALCLAAPFAIRGIGQE
ncbi:MAG: hypothetical protein M1823_007110, partial [Watsoniomyces obsoletus]